MTKKPTLTAIDTNTEEKAMTDFYNDITIDVLARTLWGEARGEGDQGMQAVANVVMNRAEVAARKGGFWWGNNVIQVCQKPYQFSCWNRSDPNFKKLQEVDESNIYFATALRLARRAQMGCLQDITARATHYHANHMTPYWAKGITPVKDIGKHKFYRLVE